MGTVVVPAHSNGKSALDEIFCNHAHEKRVRESDGHFEVLALSQ